ncbi:MAG: hypothetical protein KGO05_16735 [Chloroflexota bacterium]|nr:hypothetical protein [Chloroflexota bacterium]
MSQGKSSEHHGAGHAVKHAAAEEHHAMREARKVDSAIYMAEAVSSGDPKRIERYFLRKFAYKLFGRFMGKTINRIR